MILAFNTKDVCLYSVVGKGRSVDNDINGDDITKHREARQCEYSFFLNQLLYSYNAVKVALMKKIKRPVPLCTEPRRI